MDASVAAPQSTVNGSMIRRVLAFDALLNIGGAMVLWVAASAWATALGLDSTLPIVVFGIVFLVNGIECWVVSRRETMSPAWLGVLAAVDFAFVVFALAVAVTDPSGAEAWARWTLAMVAGGALLTGIVKLYGTLRLPGG